MWPLIAWMTTLVMQSVGRACRAPYALSAALRCSPFVCLCDTVLIIVEVPYLQYKTGCSFQVATRHVWYDRFEKESQGFDRSSEERLITELYGRVHELRTLMAKGIAKRFRVVLRYMTPQILEQQIQLQTLEAPVNEAVHPDEFLSGISPDVFTIEIPAILQVSGRSGVSTGFFPATGIREPTCSTVPNQGHCEPQAGTSERPRQPSQIIRDDNTDAPIEADVSRMSQDPADGFMCLTLADTEEPLDVSPPVSESHEVEPLLSDRPLQHTHYTGYAIDRTWRLSIGAFLIGALPQTVKVFAMRGITGTQTMVSIYLIAFIVPKVF